jgi:redox-sensitive bicupin YhaK (pirin superfamily)
VSTIRQVKRIVRGRPTMEGAGVRLTRIFGFGELPLFDPFLLLDWFGSDKPDEYVKGFPWHPHRGIETVTYVLDGAVAHGDSLGNSGTIGPGDVQWMTAGSGIIHEEMPRPGAGGRNRGFQLWVNLPASHKMIPPRYRGIARAEIPEIVRDDGARIRVIAGEYDGVAGPVGDVVAGIEYVDVSLPPRTSFDRDVNETHNPFMFVFEGDAYLGRGPGAKVTPGQAALFGEGNAIHAEAKDRPVRLLLATGEPLGEPVAWRGPIVMNSDDELETAFEEYQQGTFIKGR